MAKKTTDKNSTDKTAKPTKEAKSKKASPDYARLHEIGMSIAESLTAFSKHLKSLNSDVGRAVGAYAKSPQSNIYAKGSIENAARFHRIETGMLTVDQIVDTLTSRQIQAQEVEAWDIMSDQIKSMTIPYLWAANIQAKKVTEKDSKKVTEKDSKKVGKKAKPAKKKGSKKAKKTNK